MASISVKVTVSAAMTGDTESLQKILHALEAQTPLARAGLSFRRQRESKEDS